MKIIVDTREQKPLAFKDNMVTESVRQKLDVGDYGCEFVGGHRPPLYFERKSVSDLFATMTSGYPRFKKEVDRAAASDVALILIVEGSLTTVAKGTDFSQFAGESMVKKLFTLWIRYRLLTVYCRTRTEMTTYILETFKALGREHVRGKK